MRPAFLSATLGCAIAALAAGPSSMDARSLWEAWPQLRVSPADPWRLRHADLRRQLEELRAKYPELATAVEEGTSAEGRRIPLLKVGSGPIGVLLWSQMHGDEPTATCALLDLLHWLGAHRDKAEVRALRSKLTLWIVPMLNPDGAERGQRRNAQEIDINRDALRLSTPEGRFLKAVRDRVRPELGFNLHNQQPTYSAGARGPQAAMSLLAVPGDEAVTVTPGVRRTMQMAIHAQRLAETFAPGRVGRYDMDYTARAFGDSMSRWGTPTLLIESGGWAGPDEASRLVRLNFVVLAGTLAAIADGSLDAVDPRAYERIPLNASGRIASLVVRGARLAGGRGLPPFEADLAFQVPGPFTGGEARREPGLAELGDFGHGRGLAELDGRGLLAAPWPEAAVDWPALQAAVRARGLEQPAEPDLLAALTRFGETAVARTGFRHPVLLFRDLGQGRLRLEGAVLRGRLVGGLTATAPDPR